MRNFVPLVPGQNWPPYPLREREEEAHAILRAYGIMDTEPEANFDNIAKLAQKIFKSAAALISFVDENRQWWKAKPGIELFVGPDVTEAPRNEGYCGFVAGYNEPLVLLDPQSDDRFRENPGWKNLHVGFYAGVPIKDESGVPLGSFCVLDYKRESFTPEELEILTDLSAMVIREMKMRLQVQRAEHERDKAKESAKSRAMFLANMSHEIRTSMNALFGLGECLARTHLDPVQTEYCDLMQNSSRHLVQTIDNILDFSKIDSGLLKLSSSPFSLSGIVSLSMDMQAAFLAKKNVDIIFQTIPTDMPDMFIGDGTRLAQILLNIISNAVKFTEEGHVLIQAQQEHGFLIIRVSDTGIGMTHEETQRLFMPYSQANVRIGSQFGGTGLGLVISKALAQLMEGDVTVASVPTRGTTFTVRVKVLPFTEWKPLVLKELFGKQVLVDVSNTTVKSILREWIQSQRMLVTDNLTGSDLLVTDRDLDSKIPTVYFATVGQDIKKLASDKRVCLFKPMKKEKLLPAIWKLLQGHVITHLAPQAAPNTLSAMRILVAEDNTLNQRVLQQMLKILGITAAFETDGILLLQRLKKDYEEKLPHIIFMDLQMPRMNGLETTKKIRTDPSFTMFRNCYIIGLTANSEAEYKQACIDAGMNDYVSKPVQLEKLKSVLLGASKYIL
ncbi:hypothetical protein EDD86DRAFT_246688 [Gorgonomyces haynaldii]|nr:hypothetical protein EDD86DRAFT_246688 [Gorgonomyces haynaldii]